MHDREMLPNYRVGRGWAWPTNGSYKDIPGFSWTYCPFCGQDLPPLLSDEALRRLFRAIEQGELQQPDWLPRKPDWQADGEGDE